MEPGTPVASHAVENRKDPLALAHLLRGGVAEAENREKVAAAGDLSAKNVQGCDEKAGGFRVHRGRPLGAGGDCYSVQPDKDGEAGLAGQALTVHAEECAEKEVARCGGQ